MEEVGKIYAKYAKNTQKNVTSFEDLGPMLEALGNVPTPDELREAKDQLSSGEGGAEAFTMEQFKKWYAESFFFDTGKQNIQAGLLAQRNLAQSLQTAQAKLKRMIIEARVESRDQSSAEKASAAKQNYQELLEIHQLLSHEAIEKAAGLFELYKENKEGIDPSFPHNGSCTTKLNWIIQSCSTHIQLEQLLHTLEWSYRSFQEATAVQIQRLHLLQL